MNPIVRQRAHFWRRRLAPPLIIVAVWLLFFWPLFTPVEADRAQLAPGDFTLQFLAFRRFGLSELQQGRWPLWMPCVDSGYPYFADPQSASFYPPVMANWGLHLVSGAREFSIGALELEAALHVLFAALTAYGFLRGEVRSRLAALIGALAYSCGGYLLSYPMLQLAILETAAWLPLVVWTMRRLAARRDGCSVALAATVLALSALAGHPQTLVMMAYVAAAYFAFCAWRNRVRLLAALGWLAAAGLLALLLSAVQLLPTLEFMRLSSRAELSLDAAGTGFSLSDVAQLIAPGSVSHFSPLYIGLLPLALAALAIGAAVVNRIRHGTLESSARIWFWSVVALVALLISFGNQLPLFGVLYWLAPGFRLFRDQERYALVVVWALSLLAAYGADLLFFSLSQSTRRWLPGALLLIVIADLAANTRSVDWVRPYDPFPAQAALTVIQTDAAGGSTFRLHNEQRLPGHAACVAGLDEVGGITPIHVGSYQDFVKQVPREVRWRLLNVGYVVTWRSVLDDHLGQPVDATLLAQQGDGKDAIYTYRLNEDHPRAWIVHEALANADRAAVYAALAAPGFDPRRTAYVPAPIAVVANQAVELASIAASKPDRLAVDASLATPGLLIFSEVNYPGWRASVNGAPVPIVEVDGLLRGVVLPGGQAHVELTLQPVSLWVGLALSIAGMAACFSVCIISRNAARRRMGRAPQ
jgi:hypothetical protein